MIRNQGQEDSESEDDEPNGVIVQSTSFTQFEIQQ